MPPDDPAATSAGSASPQAEAASAPETAAQAALARARRSPAARTLALGVLLTLIVVWADRARVLVPLERWCYDRRARLCQFFTPPPTDRIVHLDIDDAALDTIGRWPWPRDTLADLVDEVRLAGADALSLDLIFPDEEDVRWVPSAATGEAVPAGPTTRPDDLSERTIAPAPGAEPARFERVDGNARLAAAFRRFGRVMVPVSLLFARESSVPAARAAAVERLTADPGLSRDEVAAGLPSGAGTLTETAFVLARREALAARVRSELSSGPVSADELRARLFPRGGAAGSLSRQFAEAYRQTASELACRRFARPAPAGGPPLLAGVPDAMPLAPFADAAWASGYANYLVFDDGVLRSIPLVASLDGKIYPQMDLALACALWGTDVGEVRVEPGRVVIPVRGRDPVVVPVRTVESPQHGAVGTFMDIPWFGGRDWQTMYDHPAGRDSRQHVPATKVWGLAESRRAMSRTIRAAAEALRPFADPTRLGLEPARAVLADPPPIDAVDAWVARLDGVLKEVGPLLDPVEQVPPAERGDEERALLAARDAIRFAVAEGRLFSAKAAELRAALGGKAVLFGGTATALGDIKPTSLHPQCPGVVVHGAVMNALLTGNFWTAAPGWVTGLATLCMGLAVTGAKVRLGPWPALAVTVGLVAGYALVNGLVLFDYGDRIVGLAGPLVVGTVVWAVLTLTSHLIERQERARITRRFKRYVDPAVVNYMLAHPELDALAGEVREMTVAFTDLAGYTSLTERLRERAVRILGRYKSLMVPVIRRHRGLIHAFMGDGIMFSYGAPEPNEEHAACAVATAFDIQAATAAFNAELAADGHDAVTTRVGICTGPAVVGDSGSDEGADYACLGNTTNLAARLESANKAVGTTIMISGRTAELLGGQYLLRPIARMVVKGKTEWAMTYEPLAKVDEATEDQRRLAAVTADMVDAFTAGRFADCATAADRLEAAFGPSKLATLYRDACDQYRDGPPPGFEGQIVLREK